MILAESNNREVASAGVRVEEPGKTLLEPEAGGGEGERVCLQIKRSKIHLVQRKMVGTGVREVGGSLSLRVCFASLFPKEVSHFSGSIIPSPWVPGLSPTSYPYPRPLLTSLSAQLLITPPEDSLGVPSPSPWTSMTLCCKVWGRGMK